VKDPEGLANRVRVLRGEILADPYFAGVESLKPDRQKTAVCFHAKDDIPEIRQLVFRLLANEAVTFYAVVRSKAGLAIDVRNRNKQNPDYRYHPNKLYDEMVRRLFRDRLHKHDSYQVYFASRGSKDRTRALKSALEQARENFKRQWGIVTSAPIEVAAMASQHSESLQAVDYYLWALQRLYTKGEDRFLRSVWHQVGLIHDVDDRRKSPAGACYSPKKAMTADSLQKNARDIGPSGKPDDHTA
jgi:hypothetical protein